jgi:dipeptide transport system substrate-binding protein
MKIQASWRVFIQVLLMGCVGLSPLFAQAKDTPHKLVFCSEGNPESLVPYSSSTTSVGVYVALNDTLISHVRGETDIIPGLAVHWQISRDGKEYTFFLRQGVKWHRNAFFEPTRDFNADDVIFSIERQRDINHPYRAVSDFNYSYFKAAGFGALLKSIKKLDNYPIKFTLNQANAAFLTMLTLPFTGMQSHDYAMAMLKRGTPEIFDANPIGVGPFSFESFEKNQRVVFKSFPDYWRGKAKIDVLEFSITPNASDRWKKLQDNMCQVMLFPNPADLAQMRKHPDTTVLEQAGLNVGFLAYNTSKPPFNDVRVRKALNMAINKAAIVERVFQGIGVAAVNLIPPTMWSYNKEVKDDVFDPVAAKQLLKEAGFPNGFTTDLWVMTVAGPTNPNPELTGQMIQTDLAAIGVKAEIKNPEWTEYANRMAHGEHAMGLYGWTTGQGDPDAFFYGLLSCEVAQSNGPNMAKFCYQPYDDLVRKARAVADPMLRIPLYEKAQQIFKEQAPWMTIAHVKQLVVIRNEVENFRLSPFGALRFYGAELKDRP